MQQIAQRGMVALALAQSPEYVAPFGAAAALYGTNPIGARTIRLSICLACSRFWY